MAKEITAQLTSVQARIKELEKELKALQLKWESDEPGRPGRMYRGLLKVIADVTDTHESSAPAAQHVEELATKVKELQGRLEEAILTARQSAASADACLKANIELLAQLAATKPLCDAAVACGTTEIIDVSNAFALTTAVRAYAQSVVGKETK